MSASTGRPRKDGVRGEGPQGEAGTKVLHHRLTGKGRSHCLCLLSRQGLWGHKLVRPGANSTAGYGRRTLPCQAWAPALLVAPHRPAQACPVHATTDSRKTAGQVSRMPAGPPTANGFKQTPGGASGGPPAHACPPILSDDPGSPTVLRAVWGQAPLPGARSTGTGASCFRPHYSAGKEEPWFSRRRNGEGGERNLKRRFVLWGNSWPREAGPQAPYVQRAETSSPGRALCCPGLQRSPPPGSAPHATFPLRTHLSLLPIF